MSEGIDLEAMTRQWQEIMLDGWSKATKQVVGSDSFAAASSSYMDWALSWQKQMRSNTGQFLDSLEFPKRSDIARISKQVTAVEMRIADLEDRLDKMTGLLSAMSTAMQKMVEHSIASSAPAAAAAEKNVETAPAKQVVKKVVKKAPVRKAKA
ncbi:MAG: hypothetical protein KIS61_12170 [Candidatus Eremiobacteraeota bacterium]|nr:hypothetical protein [Candidatus Eremiobacteraeota bacterium]